MKLLLIERNNKKGYGILVVSLKYKKAENKL
jgi:hypothetical protein